MSIRKQSLDIFKQYPTHKTGLSALGATAGSTQLAIFKAMAHNRSGGAIDLGILRSIANSKWKAYNIDASATPDAIDITSDIQIGTAVTLFNANNDGLMIQADKQFHSIAVKVTTASTGSPVFALKYFNGTSFATLTPISTVTSFVDTAYNVITFAAPIDWVPGSLAAVGGDLTSKYSMQVISTTAPTVKPILEDTAVQSSIVVGEMLAYAPAVASNGILEIDYGEFPKVFESSEFLMPYFGTAHANNIVEVSYTDSP